MGIAERKERDRQEMRKLILQTAMKLFLEQGFGNVSIRRIADKIEYSPATIYLYFKDKDEILYALHSEGFDELFRQQQAILAIKDPAERLRAHGKIYIQFALEQPEYYDLMFIMHSPARKIKEEAQWTVGLRSYEMLRKNVQECVDAGYIRNVNVDVATFAMWSLVHGIASLIIRERCPMIPQDQIHAVVNGVLDFINALLVVKKEFD